MSIAEKLTTIAENQEKVYEAGQKSVGVARTVIGNPVCCDYAHPNEHEINVQLTSDTITDFSGVTVRKYGEKVCETRSLNNISNGLTFTTNSDGVITINGTASASTFISIASPALVVGTRYRLSGCPTGGGSGKYMLYARNLSTQVDSYDYGNGVVFTAAEGSYDILIVIYVGNTVNNLQFTPTIVAEDDGTEYIANADGVVDGIRSVYPSAILIADNGAVITASYYSTGGYQKPFLDTSKPVSHHEYMFASNRWTNHLDKFDLSNITSAGYMFRNNTELITCPPLGTSKAQRMLYMFEACSNLTTIEGIDFSSCTTATNTFSSCSKLKKIVLHGTIPCTLDLGPCLVLSGETIRDVMNALSADGTDKTITIRGDALTAANADGSLPTAEWEALKAEASDEKHWSVVVR